ncbi:hypothetical protein TorRG33x02_332790 [Trema orientale]|uniref:Uncharacterized protein n=1 Tax=Trema orientale TaxID=63057 RepID=A0A2P5B4Y5_TREOI|nr:hypothetical protein TorRG33x02_332790 [Trema orientale]
MGNQFVDGNNNREASGRTSNISGIQKSLFQKPKPKPALPAVAVAVPAPAPTMHRSSVPTLVPVVKNTSTTSNKESHNFDTSNPNAKLNTTKPMMMRSSRAVSPLVRSTILISGLLSNETPPNLRTSVADDQRSASAMRGRATTPTAKPRRQSCSPSVARGRKQQQQPQPQPQPQPHEATNVRTASTKDKEINNNKGGGGGVMGSRMVDKLMNARRSSANTTTTITATTTTSRDRFKDTKPKYYSRPNLLTTTTTSTTHDQGIQSRSNSLGFGRMAISKTTNYKSITDTKRGRIIN